MGAARAVEVVLPEEGLRAGDVAPHPAEGAAAGYHGGRHVDEEPIDGGLRDEVQVHDHASCAELEEGGVPLVRRGRGRGGIGDPAVLHVSVCRVNGSGGDVATSILRVHGSGGGVAASVLRGSVRVVPAVLRHGPPRGEDR
jgi:hypothetical protein